MITLITIAFLLLQFIAVEPSNKFEGCLQYNTNHGYEHQHPYFPTSNFQHVKTNENDVKIMRFGILGNNDGHIRLSPTMYPYDKTEMNEIVLSGWANTKTVARRYTRVSPKERIDRIILKEQSSIGMLSVFEPFMFTMAVHPSGLVQLTKDGDSYPFLEFRDPKLSSKYIGFCNWDVPLVFFYDCPLEVDQRGCSGVVFSK
ncbi:uncharacterized protein LOC129771841 isoform X2 [Toxorhynchites rutilus septentrionalis]|uniref:uncharacterized protein LOC129771841 isoform X2 n=1 Tax=Toxorhynchites rutilus septentrionalis TaxID=329112 RepID=UPI00247A71D2|nr:uncharacterized protein LOC129771841 isoform X2 [Toxorhynchites rutilus septentrionalis]